VAVKRTWHDANQQPRGGQIRLKMAEGTGFEPPQRCRLSGFQDRQYAFRNSLARSGKHWS
jgi:hypothetical protein